MTSHRQDAGILDPNLCDRARREPQPSVYMLSPYTVLPPTTVLTKKRLIKQKNGKIKKLSPLSLGNTFADENVSVDDVTITGVHQTDNYFNYETVDPDKQCNLHSSGIDFLQQGELSSLAVETSSGSRKSSLAVGMPCAFYSQQSSPKLDAPAAIKFLE
nr:hypothetical protein [Tanacetum cinerariifolium]